MEGRKSKVTFCAFGLFIIAVVWGFSFVVMKTAVTEAPVMYVLAIRFLLAAIPLNLIFFKKYKTATKKDYLRGLIMGIVLIFSYVLQTYGCKYTTASNNALLTAIYGVLTPFVAWILFKKRPKILSVLFTLIAFVGVGLITLHGFEKVNIGDILTLLGGVCYAVQIVLLSEFTQKTDPIFLSMIEFLVVGVIMLCFAPIEGAFPVYLFTNFDLLWRILFLGFVCTLLCFLFQSIFQKYVPVVASGIILSLEAPIGAVGGVLINHDAITVGMIIGIVLLFLAVIGEQTYPTITQKIKLKRTQPVVEPKDDEN